MEISLESRCIKTALGTFVLELLDCWFRDKEPWVSESLDTSFPALLDRWNDTNGAKGANLNLPLSFFGSIFSLMTQTQELLFSNLTSGLKLRELLKIKEIEEDYFGIQIIFHFSSLKKSVN